MKELKRDWESGIPDFIKKLNEGRPVAHDCQRHLDVSMESSQYPPSANVVCRKCRICGHLFYNPMRMEPKDKTHFLDRI